MNEDPHILKQYIRDGSRETLDQLVRRYRDLVYSAALRQVRDPHLAEDLTQAVFIVLSRKANTIREGVAIGGWLLAVTRRASVDAMRKRAIQHRHEHAAARAEALTDQNSASEWEQIAPVIDEAMSHLSSKDRDAVVLRYFEDQPFAQVGQVLCISEAAARKRVRRALERLRGLLSRRGATLGVAALGMMMTAHSVHASPLTMTISTTAASNGAMGIAKGAIQMMAWAKAKAAAVVGLISLVALGGGVMVVTYTMAQQAGNTAQSANAVDGHQAIQGTWRLVYQARGGQPPQRAILDANIQAIITDKEILFSAPGQDELPVFYAIDPSHQPKWINLTTAGRMQLGLYELVEPDSLNIYISTDGGSRPSQIQMRPQADQKDYTLIVLRRVSATTQNARAVEPGKPTTMLTALLASNPTIAPADSPGVSAAVVDMANLETALDAFEIDTGHYPTGAQGLVALVQSPFDGRLGSGGWHGPYVRSMPQDPWQHPYRYMSPGIYHKEAGFDLWSAGPDGIDGTDDDITNWQK